MKQHISSNDDDARKRGNGDEERYLHDSPKRSLRGGRERVMDREMGSGSRQWAASSLGLSHPVGRPLTKVSYSESELHSSFLACNSLAKRPIIMFAKVRSPFLMLLYQSPPPGHTCTGGFTPYNTIPYSALRFTITTSFYQAPFTIRLQH